MKIRRPVTVKLILTEATREKLRAELGEAIRQVQLELEQLQFQAKKLLAEAQKKGPEAFRIVKERLEREEKMRMEKKEQLAFKRKQVEALPLGSEIFHGTVESEVEIRVGDSWEDLMKGTEIILKDGYIYEIREGRRRNE
ncbi:YlqD family protein [Bacillaceae bacterium]